MTKNKGKRTKNGKKNARSMGWIAAPIAAGVLILATIVVCVCARFETGIYPGVRMEGVELGGMSPVEAADALRESGIIRDEKITLTVNLPADNQLVVDAALAGAVPSAESAATTAYNYGRSKGFLGRGFAWLRGKLGGVALSVADGEAILDEEYIRQCVKEAAARADEDLMGSDMQIGEEEIQLIKGIGQVLVDEEALCADVMAALQNRDFTGFSYIPEMVGDEGIDLAVLREKIRTEAQDAVFDKETGVSDHVVGRDFDLEAAQKLWDETELGEMMVIPLILTQPEVTREWLEDKLFADELGKMVTSLGSSNANRLNNIQLACAAIDGLILMPGEEFSYNGVVGERTTARGYKAAGAYSGGKVVLEVGGGICQVSTTLYCAAVYANLQITNRLCHNMTVSYVPTGMDATVSWGGPDFRFVNSREYPIKIKTNVDVDEWTVEISVWGTDTDGSYVKFTSAAWPIYDKDGEEDGYGAVSYREVYSADGVL
ncbi:MAG: VanW family protein, partial [Oscillospiraceae bacterium]|nr:VanW family protein [Oscillospiraceae bacterium]